MIPTLFPVRIVAGIAGCRAAAHDANLLINIAFTVNGDPDEN
jgi:hypothetical protein